MLVRADPETKSISLLSFPRDLYVQVVCPGGSTFNARINAAYSECGTKGTLETVKKLTGLPVNYLITVNFRGFRQLVDSVGGVWMDVDRRYFNDRGGDFGYATINLFPGYQKLGGYQALDFVRYRHTDSGPLPRRAAAALRAGVQGSGEVQHERVRPAEAGLHDHEERRGRAGRHQGARPEDRDPVRALRLRAAAWALLPGEARGSRGDGSFDLLAHEQNVKNAVQEFANPDVESPEKATAVALNEKPKPAADTAPPVRETTVNVLNGNGVAGSAGTASYLLSQRGYQMVYAPDGKNGNAPNWEYFKTRIHFNKAQPGAEAAAKKVAVLFGTDDVVPLDPAIRAPLERCAADRDRRPDLPRHAHGGARRQDAAAPAGERRAGRGSVPGTAPGAGEQDAVRADGSDRDRAQLLDRPRAADPRVPDRPEGKHKTIRLTYRTGASKYWGVQMTDWEDAPVLAEHNVTRTIKGRNYQLHYVGPKLHMVVLRQGGATYWVVNTLLDELSNETMLAIAKGLKPLRNIK